MRFPDYVVFMRGWNFVVTMCVAPGLQKLGTFCIKCRGFRATVQPMCYLYIRGISNSAPSLSGRRTLKTGRGEHHWKPPYGTDRRREKRWNEIEQACPSVEARSDQPRLRPRKSA